MRPVGITQKKAAGKYFPVPLRHAIICAMPHINHGDKRIVSKEFVIAAQLQNKKGHTIKKEGIPLYSY